MRFLYYVSLWRWHAWRGKWFARLSANHNEAAARYREWAYADASDHAERVELMQRKR